LPEGLTSAAPRAATTSRGLTVTGGSEVAQITLEGAYAISTFTVSSDDHGGTKVVDPSRSSGGSFAARLSPFVAAMATFGETTAASSVLDGETWRESVSVLATPLRASA